MLTAKEVLGPLETDYLMADAPTIKGVGSMPSMQSARAGNWLSAAVQSDRTWKAGRQFLLPTSAFQPLASGSHCQNLTRNQLQGSLGNAMFRLLTLAS